MAFQSDFVGGVANELPILDTCPSGGGKVKNQKPTLYTAWMTAGLACMLSANSGTAWAICEAEANRHIAAELLAIQTSRNTFTESLGRSSHSYEIDIARKLSTDGLRSMSQQHDQEFLFARAGRPRNNSKMEIDGFNASLALKEFRACYGRALLAERDSPSNLEEKAKLPYSSGKQNAPYDNQAFQQQSQQAQQSAQQNQARADQQRQGKRKTNDPAAQAHECISLDKDPGLFGGFKNNCSFKVNFSTCNFKPRVKQGGFNWSADFDCEKGKFGLHTPDAGKAVTAHNHNTELVYWFACKAPATPVDASFVVGKGIEARCHN